jgi:hypothetical protein
MIGMTQTISSYIDKIPHLSCTKQLGLGGWQETSQ